MDALSSREIGIACASRHPDSEPLTDQAFGHRQAQGTSSQDDMPRIVHANHPAFLLKIQDDGLPKVETSLALENATGRLHLKMVSLDDTSIREAD